MGRGTETRGRPGDLLGRSSEEAALRAVLAGEGGSRVAVVRGEAGIGKSALVRQVLEGARALGRTVLTGAALEMERERPFGAIVDAVGVNRHHRDARLLRVTKLLRDPGGAGLPAAEVRHAVVEHLVDVIEERSSPDGAVLAIEDIHWADPSTLLTLARLLGRLPYADLSILCTLRPLPEPEGLAAFLEAVERASGTVVDLGPLGADDVAALVARLVGREPSPEFARKFDAAGGNPFFVHELAAAFDEESEADDVRLPATLRATVLNRFRFLDSRAHELMSVASVLGGAFSLDDLSVVVDEPASDLLAVLRDCIQAGVLRDAEDRLAFRHDLVREALYEEMPAAVRRGLHAQVGRALAAAGRPAAQVATHFVGGASPGDRDAVVWLRRAADEASLTAPSIAVELLERALSLTTDRSTADEIHAEMAINFGLLRRYKEVEETAARLMSAPLPPALSRRLQTAVLQSLTSQGRVDEQIEMAERLIAAAPDDVARARLSAELALSLFLAGRAAEALERATSALTAGEQFDDGATISAALLVLSVAAVFAGRPTDALAYIERRQSITSSVLGGEAGGTAVTFQAGIVKTICYYELDRVDESNAAQRELIDELTRAGVPDPASEMRGTATLVLGLWDEAIAETQAALAAHRELGFSRTIGTAVAILAIILVHRGELDEARRLLDEADADLAARRGGNGIDLLMLGWARAVLLEATGDDRKAFDVYDFIFSVLRVGDAVPPYRNIAPDIARVAVAVGREDVAQKVADELSAVAALEPGVASLQGTALRTKASASRDSALMIEAVDAFRRSPRLPEHAYAAEEAATLLVDAGRRQEAVAYFREALDIYGRLGAARLVARVDAALRSLGVKRGASGGRNRPKTGWESLTEAEGRVVALIGDGLSNPEIAERLYISKRTVETHVSNIMRKVGVSSRAQLTAQAARQAAGV